MKAGVGWNGLGRKTCPCPHFLIGAGKIQAEPSGQGMHGWGKSRRGDASRIFFFRILAAVIMLHVLLRM